MPGATSTASCAGAPSVAGWWWRSGWRWSAPSSSAVGWSAALGPATAGTADRAVGPDPTAQARVSCPGMARALLIGKLILAYTEAMNDVYKALADPTRRA